MVISLSFSYLFTDQSYKGDCFRHDVVEASGITWYYIPNQAIILKYRYLYFYEDNQYKLTHVEGN